MPVFAGCADALVEEPKSPPVWGCNDVAVKRPAVEEGGVAVEDEPKRPERIARDSLLE
jgi:hypothetical protein